MADIKSGEPFGIDPDALKTIDWELALARVIHDIRSDFIYAPHFAFIYSRAGAELISQLKAQLGGGKFSPICLSL